MVVTFKSPECVVIDDVLPASDFSQVVAAARQLSYRSPHLQQWRRVWRLNDGNVMQSSELYAASQPSPPAFGLLFEKVKAIASEHSTLLGTWMDVNLRAYLYPRGARLSWHIDVEGKATGSFSFYVHDYWSCSWGGELHVAQQRGGPAFSEMRSITSLDPRKQDEELSAPGVFMTIVPKPNRLVLVGPTVPHMIARVDEAAGENVRCSLTGFFFDEIISQRHPLKRAVRTLLGRR